MRSAIIIGATGLVGSALVQLLCESKEYVSVTAIARKNLTFKHPKLTVKIRSFEEIEEEDIDFADEVFCCLGTTMKKAGTRAAFEKVDVQYPLHIASLAKKRGIMHFILISAMGAKENSPFYYNRVKGKLEHEIIALELPRISIIRPSLLVGERQEFRLGEKIGEKLLNVLNPMLLGPFKKYRSIEAKQVAFAMKVIALHGKKAPVSIYSSVELAEMKMPKPKEEKEEEIIFNWDRFKEDDLDLVDREVVFEKRFNEESKLEPIDEEVTFQRNKNNSTSDD